MSTRLAVRCLHPHHRGHRCRRCRRALVYAERALVGMLRGWGSGAATAAEPTSSDALVVAVHDLCTLTVRKGTVSQPTLRMLLADANSSATHLHWSRADSYNPTLTVTRLAGCPSAIASAAQTPRFKRPKKKPRSFHSGVSSELSVQARPYAESPVLAHMLGVEVEAPSWHVCPSASSRRSSTPRRMSVASWRGWVARGKCRGSRRAALDQSLPLHQRFISSMLRQLALFSLPTPRYATQLHIKQHTTAAASLPPSPSPSPVPCPAPSTTTRPSSPNARAARRRCLRI
ncbi:hypothetical protein DFH06DRAFT_1256660, partial [Mycena polygramma]